MNPDHLYPGGQPTVSESVGQRIRRLRVEHGMTQRELAAAVGCGHNHVSWWECNRQPPGPRFTRRLAAVLNTTMGDIISGSERSPGSEIADLQRRVATLEHAVAAIRQALVATRPVKPPYHLAAAVPRDPVADLRRQLTPIP